MFTNTFTYDGLDRLRVASSSITGGGGGGGSLFATEQYSFDTLGRMTTRTIGGTTYTYAYGLSAHVDAPTQYYGGSTNNSYSYDANGNQVGGTVNGVYQTRTFDAENRVSQIITGTTASSFVYDANGQRVIKSVGCTAFCQGQGTTRTLYVGNLYEETITTGNGGNGGNGAAPYISYYSFGGKLVGMRRVGQTTGSNGQYRIVGDHLGSVSLIVDTSSPPNVVQRQYNKPYGETAWQYTASTGSSLTDYGYTGQRSDADSGLMYYGARYYDPVLSQFTSADPTIPNATKPGDMNRYGYTRWNPLRFIDPSGLAPEDYYVIVFGCVSNPDSCGSDSPEDYARQFVGDVKTFLFRQYQKWVKERARFGEQLPSWQDWSKEHVRLVATPDDYTGANNLEDTLKSIPGDAKINLWGHSQGAAAILWYLMKKYLYHSTGDERQGTVE